MYLRIFWHVLLDRRVPVVAKMLLVLPFLYSLFPRTWAWGPWDNLVLLALAVLLLLALARRSTRPINPKGQTQPAGEREGIVEARSYRVLDDEGSAQ